MGCKCPQMAPVCTKKTCCVGLHMLLMQVLVNGPGTCIPVCAAAFVNRWVCCAGPLHVSRCGRGALHRHSRLCPKQQRDCCVSVHTHVLLGWLLSWAGCNPGTSLNSCHMSSVCCYPTACVCCQHVCACCRVLLWFDSRIIYVESIARVRKLSLSGTILYWSRMADKFFVQWPELQQRFPRSTYAGRLY